MSPKKIVTNSIVNTAISGAVSVAPKVINKSLSGKYQKLNNLEKIVKRVTDGPYQGKYSSGPNYLADSLSGTSKNALKNIGINLFKLLAS